MAAIWGGEPGSGPSGEDSGLPWRVWDLGDTWQPLAEGTEQACRAAAVALAFTRPRVVLEDPGGREWFYRPVTPGGTA